MDWGVGPKCGRAGLDVDEVDIWIPEDEDEERVPVRILWLLLDDIDLELLLAIQDIKSFVLEEVGVAILADEEVGVTILDDEEVGVISLVEEAVASKWLKESDVIGELPLATPSFGGTDMVPPPVPLVDCLSSEDIPELGPRMEADNDVEIG